MTEIVPAPPQLFVSAPAGADLWPLLDGLRRRGGQPFVLTDVAALGGDILHSLRIAIGRADQVIVVLGDTSALNQAFEAGIAVALGKPLLIIAPPGSAVPADLGGLVMTRARVDDLDAINFALDHVRPQTPWITREPSPPTGRPLGPDAAERLLERLGDPAVTERSALAVLTEAIEASGGLAAPGGTGDQRFDLGVWSDDLEAIGGNPLIIELRRTLTPGAVDQALRMVGRHPSAQLALVVYLEPGTADFEKARFPVPVISLQQLIRRMSSASFAEVVRDLRNQLAHGTGRS